MKLARGAQAAAPEIPATTRPPAPARLPASGLRRSSTSIAIATLLHLGVLLAILRSLGETAPPVIPPQPLMAVALVPRSEDKPAFTPAPEPARAPEKVIRKTVQPKSIPTQATPAEKPVLASTPSATNPVESSAPAAAAPSVAATPSPARETPLPVVAPRFDAAYLANPVPEYPRQSRRLGEEGRVMLRVHVGADGKPLEVTIAKSSGYTRLDEVARDTVLRSWRFVPARQGDQAVAGTVRVPIDFTLDS